MSLKNQNVQNVDFELDCKNVVNGKINSFDGLSDFHVVCLPGFSISTVSLARR